MTATIRSIPEVSLVEFKVVLAQERDEFLLKGQPPMVLRLARDIALDTIQMGITDSEGPIPRLPGERMVLRKGLMNPFGRIGLEEAEGMRHGQLFAERTEEMHMIRHTSRGQEDAVFGAENSAEVRVEAWLQIGGDRGGPALGAEDEMVVETGI